MAAETSAAPSTRTAGGGGASGRPACGFPLFLAPPGPARTRPRSLGSSGRWAGRPSSFWGLRRSPLSHPLDGRPPQHGGLASRASAARAEEPRTYGSVRQRHGRRRRRRLHRRQRPARVQPRQRRHPLLLQARLLPAASSSHDWRHSGGRPPLAGGRWRRRRRWLGRAAGAGRRLTPGTHAVSHPSPACRLAPPAAGPPEAGAPGGAAAGAALAIQRGAEPLLPLPPPAAARGARVLLLCCQPAPPSRPPWHCAASPAACRRRCRRRMLRLSRRC